MAKSTVQQHRHNAVLIRVSSDGQQKEDQKHNVEHMLAKRGITVPEDYWKEFTVSRSKVLAGKEFEQVMAEVQANRIDTIFVESQDRFGGKNSKELFSILNTLQKHGTKLIDLTEDMDLTSDELINEIRTFLASQKSQEELRSIGRRSLRSRVNSFKSHGNWSNGASPYGYGKQLRRADDGTIRWEWYPTANNAIGDRYNLVNGKLVLSEQGVKVPPRDRVSGNAQADRVYLVPHRDKQIVRTVQLIFELYAEHGLSLRQIAIRLNDEGHTYYGKPFEFNLVNEILKNEAYTGNTVLGKRPSGEYYGFDAEGSILKIKKDATEAEQAAIAQTITMKGTHKPLISMKLWQQAQQRRAREAKHRDANNAILAPRSPDYYLKGLLVCGHCGRYMTSRKEKRGALYVCSQYSNRHSSGLAKECGYQTIAHTDAEKLILDELKKRNVELDQLIKGSHKETVRKRLVELTGADEANTEQARKVVAEGTAAMASYFKQNYELTEAQLRAIKYASEQFLEWGGKLDRPNRERLPVDFAEFKAAFQQAESLAIAKASKKLEKLRDEHTELTFYLVKATPQQQDKLQPKVLELEAQIAEWQNKCRPMRERLRELGGNYRSLKAEQDQLLKEWVGMDDRVKGEALKRIIDKVVLYWDKEWHGEEANPTRERKTKRPGRWRYTLDLSKTEWVFQGSDSLGGW